MNGIASGYYRIIMIKVNIIKKGNILGVNLENYIHSYHSKFMLVTKWLLNYSKIVILLILNNNDSQSSLVEMNGVSWSKRNVIKLSSVIKTPCNEGEQNTELPSDALRLIFFFFSQAYASFPPFAIIPSSFFVLSSMSIL